MSRNTLATVSGVAALLTVGCADNALEELTLNVSKEQPPASASLVPGGASERIREISNEIVWNLTDLAREAPLPNGGVEFTDYVMERITLEDSPSVRAVVALDIIEEYVIPFPPTAESTAFDSTRFAFQKALFENAYSAIYEELLEQESSGIPEIVRLKIAELRGEQPDESYTISNKRGSATVQVP